MSVYVMSWVFRDSRSTGSDRLVLLAIADRCNDEGTDAWPSIATLAAKARLSESTTRRSIRSLERLGELVVELGGGHRSNRYKVVMHPGQSDRGQNDTPVTGDRAAQSPVTDETSLRPKAPLTPRAGGDRRKRAHCEQHGRYRGDCAPCRAADRPAPTRPAWCGVCDEVTRLLTVEDTIGRNLVRRCTRCHPLAPAASDA